MGQFAVDVNERLCTRLASAVATLDWRTEHLIGGTPVDVAGVGRDLLVAVELEWRRADPADNAAKLFRHISEGTIGANRVVVVHLFSRYYDLASGGVSSKRKNAEFVGRMALRAIGASGEERLASGVAVETVDSLSYHPVTLDIDPPKRGGERPADWTDAVDAGAATVAELSRGDD